MSRMGKVINYKGKKIGAYLYTIGKFGKGYREVINTDYPFLYSGGVYPTKLTVSDLPDDYIPIHSRVIWYMHGFLRTSGITDMKYTYVKENHLFKDDYLYDHASLSTTLQMIDICGKYPISKDEIVEIRLSTDLEKKQLFDALAKENKTWDAEKKAIVDLKPLWTPKPFDRVVTRVDDDAIWTANIFSHIDSYGEYNTIGCVGGYPYCLPYNEETAKLIGTTNNWEG